MTCWCGLGVVSESLALLATAGALSVELGGGGDSKLARRPRGPEVESGRRSTREAG
jgi:hypothetical protein